jgi:hypothetical protein
MQLQRLHGSVFATFLIGLATAHGSGHDAAMRCVSMAATDKLTLLTVCPVR